MKLRQNTAVSETSGVFFLKTESKWNSFPMISYWNLIYAHDNKDMRVQQTDVKNCYVYFNLLHRISAATASWMN